MSKKGRAQKPALKFVCLFLNRSSNRTYISASTAGSTAICIDLVLAVTLGDSTGGAFSSAGAA